MLKSFNQNRENGCPFNSDIFTNEVVVHILNEGFEWQDNTSTYCENDSDNYATSIFGCYYMNVGYSNGDWPINVFICENGICVDNDYECGGNSWNIFFEYKETFEETFNEVISYINRHK